MATFSQELTLGTFAAATGARSWRIGISRYLRAGYHAVSLENFLQAVKKSRAVSAVDTESAKERVKARERFARALRFARADGKLMQKDVARQIGVTRPLYAKWEAGDHLPAPEHVAALERFFKKPPGWFTSDHEVT